MEDVRLTLAGCMSATEVMDGILALKEEIKLKVVILLWCWWDDRNKLDQGRSRRSTEEICNSITYHFVNMEKLKLFSPPPPPRPSFQKQKWQPPPENIYKINCDGTFMQDTKKGGWGCIIQDIKVNSWLPRLDLYITYQMPFMLKV